MGGHIVTGHVDGVGVIRKKEVKGGHAELEVMPPPGIMGQVVKKGSIAIDGISLTVAETFKDEFRVTLIPHTLNNTTLSFKGPGDRLNIETDIIAKYVGRLLSSYKTGRVTEEFLIEHGF
jgi:riboflavin synthase